jgi:hypothetical protein
MRKIIVNLMMKFINRMLELNPLFKENRYPMAVHMNANSTVLINGIDLNPFNSILPNLKLVKYSADMNPHPPNRIITSMLKQ